MWKPVKTKQSGITLAAVSYVACLAFGSVYMLVQAHVHAVDAVPISTCQQLQDIDQNLAGNYVLASNIDCSDSRNWNNGLGFIPIGMTKSATPFTGTLDGQGHTISGLTINLGNTDHDAGLFFAVKDTTIQSVSFSGSSVSGHANAGTLAAGAVDSNLSNIRVNGGTVTVADEESTSTGGLVGLYMSNGGSHALSDSYFNGNVNGHASTGGLVGRASSVNIRTSYSTGTVSGTAGVGGLVGRTTGGTVLLSVYSHANVNTSGENSGGLVGLHGDGSRVVPSIDSSYASGTVRSAADSAGGLVGTLQGTIQRSFAAGSVSGASGANNIGGLVGRYISGTSTDNAYDQGRTGQTNCIGGGSCTGVLAVNTPGGPNGNYFFGTLANSPLSHWDAKYWSPKAKSLPVLPGLPRSVGQTTTIAAAASVQINWAAASDDIDTPDITGYVLRYRPTGPSGNWTSFNDIAARTNNDFTVSGLAPNTSYSFALFTKNATGLSGSLAFTAKTTAPTGPPQSSTHSPGSSTPPQPVPPPPPATPAPGSAPAAITIGYRGDFLRSGRTVSNLRVGDVVHFSVTRNGKPENHSATVKEVGKDYLIFTIASDPFDVRLDVGKAKTISVHQDGHMDLQIKPGKITDNNAAIVTFKALGTAPAKATAVQAATVNRQDQPWAWAGAIALIFGCAAVSTAIRVKRVQAAQAAEAQDQAEFAIAALASTPKAKKEQEKERDRPRRSVRKRQAASSDTNDDTSR